MDKKKAEQLLSRALGKKTRISELSLVGSGYHSDGFKAISKNGTYFIKAIKSKDLGFEFPERKLLALTLSHNMNVREQAFPRSLGVIADSKGMQLIPKIDDSTIFYNIQEYGGDAKSYLSILEDRKSRKAMLADDKREIEWLTTFISDIHKIMHPSKDRKQLNAVYNDYLRNIIGHQEYTLQLLHAFPKDAPILAPGKQAEYIGLLLEQMHFWKDRSDRMTALHGDFWAANVMLGKKAYVVDYSRMPWGDPGFDVGFFVSYYVFMWHNTNNDYFKGLCDKFLELYIKKTGDKEIRKTMVYPFGLIAIMYANPVWVPGIDLSVRKDFYDHVVMMLRRREFFWV